MTPRLKTSKKWTAFPIEFQQQILQTFEDNLGPQMTDGHFIVDGRIYPEEILFRVGFLETGRLFQANFEASVQYSDKEPAQKSINTCIDATASMLEQYYQSNQLMEMPRDWKEFEFDKKKIFLKFTTVNTELEAEADKLLGLHEDQLVHEELNPSVDLADEVAELSGDDIKASIQQQTLGDHSDDEDPSTHHH